MKNKYYSSMSNEKQKSIDQEMMDKFKARPSHVTNQEWQDMKNGVWICAYAHMPDDEKIAPDLFMVHHYTESNTTIFYRHIHV